MNILISLLSITAGFSFACAILIISQNDKSVKNTSSSSDCVMPVDAEIVGVFQSQDGQWWTTLSWAVNNRATWNNKLGKEGDVVKIYPLLNGNMSIQPDR